MKRMLSCLLCLVLTLGLCAGALAELNPPGSKPISNEKIHLTIGLAEEPTVLDYETNGMTLLLEEYGYDLDFVYYPSKEMATKIDLEMMAGGADLPDIVLISLTMDTLQKYAEYGLIYDLTEYYENGDAYYITQANESGDFDIDLLGYVRTTDGHYYSFPNISDSLENQTRERIMISKEWLDALELNIPETTEDFVNVLRAFKTQDPNGNGIADEVPFMGSSDRVAAHLINFFMTPFVYAVKEINYLYNDNGTVKAAYMQDGWKEGLRYMRGLVEEELISPLTFTQSGDQVGAFVGGSEDMRIGGTITQLSKAYPGYTNQDFEDKIYMLDHLALPGSDPVTPYAPVTPTMRGIITTNCKDPEAAFRFLDLCCSEEFSVMTRFGIQGIDWVTPTEEEAADFPFAILGYEPFMKEISQWGKPNNNWWYNANPAIRSARMLGGRVGSTGSNLVMSAAAARAHAYIDVSKPVAGLIYTTEESEILNPIQTDLINCVLEYYTRFVMGDLDIDQGWEDFQEQLKIIGVDEYLEIVQAAYDRMYGDK